MRSYGRLPGGRRERVGPPILVALCGSLLGKNTRGGTIHWSAEYGAPGIRTSIVNHGALAHERERGATTASVALEQGARSQVRRCIGPEGNMRRSISRRVNHGALAHERELGATTAPVALEQGARSQVRRCIGPEGNMRRSISRRMNHGALAHERELGATSASVALEQGDIRRSQPP